MPRDLRSMIQPSNWRFQQHRRKTSSYFQAAFNERILMMNGPVAVSASQKNHEYVGYSSNDLVSLRIKP